MDILEAGFSLAKFLVLGFVGLIGGLFLLAVLFGKRKHTRWEYEAEFLNDAGREIGEFDLELSKFDKEDDDYVQRAKLRLRHEALVEGGVAEVWIDEVQVFSAPVEVSGRVFLESTPPHEVVEPKVGQTCSVRTDGAVIAEAELQLD